MPPFGFRYSSITYILNYWKDYLFDKILFEYYLSTSTLPHRISSKLITRFRNLPVTILDAACCIEDRLFVVASFLLHLIRASFKTRHDFCRSLKRHYHCRRWDGGGKARIWHNVSPGHRRNVLFIATTAYVLFYVTLRSLSISLSPPSLYSMHSNAPLTLTSAFCHYSCPVSYSFFSYFYISFTCYYHL